MAAKRVKKNYVNNADFLQAITDYRNKCNEYESVGRDIPKVPDYIGKCIFDIATKLATKPNFYGYAFREDMIMDGVENCLVYIRNFDPEKSQNPFAYFTQIIWYAFLRKIQKEKKQLYIRYKSSTNALDNHFAMDNGEQDTISNIATNDDIMNNFVKDFENKLAKNKVVKV
jgi:hypothetical protein